MGYSSYQLMKNLIDIKTTMQNNTEIDKKVEVLLNYLCNCKRVYLEKQDMVIKKSKMLPK